jgi:hypothetical protein
LDISFTSLYLVFAVLLRAIHNITNTIQIEPKYFSRVPWTMTSTGNKIDTEWANSLVGLHLKVPDHWWVNYSGTNLHDVNRTPAIRNLPLRVTPIFANKNHALNTLKIGRLLTNNVMLP